jgi:tetratricopeptide (TPR) repeat protein
MGNCCSGEDATKTRNNKLDSANAHDPKANVYAPADKSAAAQREPVFTSEAQQIFDGISSMRTALRNKSLKMQAITEKINEIQNELRKLRKLAPQDSDNQILLARSLNALGHTISTDHIGRAEEGLGLQKEALGIYKNYYKNTDNEVLATSLDRVGVTTLNRGQNFDEAIGYLTQALEMRRRLFGANTDHAEVCASLNSLAVAFEWVGRFDEATKLQAEALSMYMRLHPEKRGCEEDDAFNFMNAMSGVMTTSPRKQSRNSNNNNTANVQQQQQQNMSDSAINALLGSPNPSHQQQQQQHHKEQEHIGSPVKQNPHTIIPDDEFL